MIRTWACPFTTAMATRRWSTPVVRPPLTRKAAVVEGDHALLARFDDRASARDAERVIAFVRAGGGVLVHR